MMSPADIQPVRRALLATALSAPLGAWAQPAKLPRLVTISGAITEVVYALGAEAQLVGTDTTSLYPAAALKTPKVGYLRQLSAEGVLSLQPDAVDAPPGGRRPCPCPRSRWLRLPVPSTGRRH